MEMTGHGSATTPEAAAGEEGAARTLPRRRKDLFAAVAWIETARVHRGLSVRATKGCQGNSRRTWANCERP